MSELDMQPVLRCERCNKPFDKKSTLKRHGYYCQSLKGGGTTRCRSCITCARRKARCDNRRPACSGCVTRGVECQYPANTPKGTGRGLRAQQRSDVSPAQWPTTTPSLASDSSTIANHLDASNHHSLLDVTLGLSDPAASSSGDVYFGWDDPAIDLADFINPRANDEALQLSSSQSPAVVCDSTPWTVQSVQLQRAISSPYMSTPSQPLYPVSSFIQRPKLEVRAQRTASLILHTLKSYPLMMLRHNNLPPFIHPRFMPSEAENDSMEPLNNCMSLLHMVSSRVPGSRKLFWRNVQMECERFCAEHVRWNKWELLAALQALSVYLIMRLDEGQRDNNKLDFLLVAAVATIATQLGRIDATSDSDLATSWDDWIFEESKRRLCVIYQIVDMLVYFEPADMCHVRKSDLLIAPLPAKKQLWEAGNELTWKAESEREETEARVAFALAANGELVKMDQSQLHCTTDVLRLHKPLDAGPPARCTANWDEWCSGMDGFGGLVVLAASLTA